MHYCADDPAMATRSHYFAHIYPQAAISTFGCKMMRNIYQRVRSMNSLVVMLIFLGTVSLIQTVIVSVQSINNDSDAHRESNEGYANSVPVDGAKEIRHRSDILNRNIDEDKTWNEASTRDDAKPEGAQPDPSPTSQPSASPSSTPSSSPTEGIKSPSLLLSYDWTNLQLYSEQAKTIYDHQHNCSIPWIRYELRTWAMGLGSELHVWSYALNESMRHKGYRIRTHVPQRDHRRPQHTPSWDWIDHQACGDPFHTSQLDCYFPGAEPTCGLEQTSEWANMSVVESQIRCSAFNEDTVTWRAASMEFLFSKVSPLVVDEAERQARAVFGKNGTIEFKKVPVDLILVHMRWGDKFVESKLFNVDEYIVEIQKVVDEHKLKEVNILLCTEDPSAVTNFENRSQHLGWNVYIDHFYTEFLPYRLARPKSAFNMAEFNVVLNIAQDLEGKPGLWALGSVLVAMEAKYYILTLSSNWSRLYNELRKNVVDPRCDNCTVLIDLSHGGEC